MQQPAADALPALAQRIRQGLGHAPTAGQERALEAFQRLLCSSAPAPALILSGYAGTGKTALVGALVGALAALRVPTVLLAPTGRAAKVLAASARAEASTIHRRIYRLGEGIDGPRVSVAANRQAGALFIVDEASMIGGAGANEGFGSRDLLGDLIEHVFAQEGCKLLFIGDPAQLPPVGSLLSPALDPQALRALGLTAGIVRLTEVVRQAKGSGILRNATALREAIGAASAMPPAGTGPDAPIHPPVFIPSADVVRIDGLDLQDALESAYARDGDDEVCVVCRSNKRAYQYNMQVRSRIHGNEEEVSPGDRLMVVRNDYLWAGLNGKPELIANGELVTVRRVLRVEQRHGLRFADMVLGWWNGAEQRELEAKVMLDTLAADGPALPLPRLRALAEAIVEEQQPLTRAARSKVLREDPCLNALQVKYAYAVTGHKAQGGQWRTVFVDQGWLTEEMIDREWLRWLYTAVTRATERLYLLNFHGRFWGEG
ncbi:MAG: ATP-dependent RecD-like DNA helicase [Flavobacteriales bacterium]